MHLIMRLRKSPNRIATLDPRGSTAAVAWPLPVAELIPSQRDVEAPLLRDVADELPFAYTG